jgi:hypothetical protein
VLGMCGIGKISWNVWEIVFLSALHSECQDLERGIKCKGPEKFYLLVPETRSAGHIYLIIIVIGNNYLRYDISTKNMPPNSFLYQKMINHSSYQLITEKASMTLS